VVLLEQDDYGERRAELVHGIFALARCPCCGHRFRVLPSDVLPRKTYSVGVIEHMLTEYARGERSLRSVAWETLGGERTPAHTSLHAWSEGLGAHALGLAGGEVEGGAPVSRLFAETQSRVQEIGPLLTHDYAVDPRRYRSSERRERLSATSRILAIAEAATGLSAPFAFARWRELALRWSNTCALVFRSGISSTAIGHRARPEGRGSRAPLTRGTDPCRTPTRSPPGASNRSPR
jgi:hypothetical protein